MGYAGCEAILQYGLEYMSQRSAFGRTINKFQVLRHRVAQMAAEIESVKFFILHTCRMNADGKYAVKESSMAKLLATELADKCTYQVLQFLGGYGYMEEYKAARAFRDARIGTIGGGSSEIMREIIAKMVIDDTNYERAESKNTVERPKLETVADIFATLPSRFKADKAKDKKLNVHFQFTSDAYTVNIEDGKLKVENGLHGNADCLVETDDETYINVETGKLNPQEAFMTGKIKVSDLMQMMAFGGLFKKL